MLTEVLTHVANELTLAGIDAAIDARDLVLPGVWVTLDRIGVPILAATGVDVSVALIAVAGDSGTTIALGELDAILTALPAHRTPAEWEALVLRLPNHAPDPLPALRGTITLTWNQP